MNETQMPQTGAPNNQGRVEIPTPPPMQTPLPSQGGGKTAKWVLVAVIAVGILIIGYLILSAGGPSGDVIIEIGR